MAHITHVCNGCDWYRLNSEAHYAQIDDRDPHTWIIIFYMLGYALNRKLKLGFKPNTDMEWGQMPPPQTC